MDLAEAQAAAHAQDARDDARRAAGTGDRTQEAGLQLHRRHRLEAAQARHYGERHRHVGGGHHRLRAQHAGALHVHAGDGQCQRHFAGARVEHAQIERAHPGREQAREGVLEHARVGERGVRVAAFQGPLLGWGVRPILRNARAIEALIDP
ncbi:MAG: hypothetical protein AMXMBFR66_01390 [Pseudomonadota bacterium]